MLLANGADLSLHLFSGTTALSLAKSERMRDYLNGEYYRETVMRVCVETFSTETAIVNEYFLTV